MRPRDTIQSVELLSDTRPGSDPHCINWWCMPVTCNPSTGEVKAGGSIQGYLQLQSLRPAWATQEPVSNKTICYRDAEDRYDLKATLDCTVNSRQAEPCDKTLTGKKEGEEGKEKNWELGMVTTNCL